jgi:hypothetical protein
MKDEFSKVMFVEGKEYKTVGGECIAIIRNNLSGKYPVLGIDNKKVLWKYTENGKHIEEGFKHPMDLLKC